jgi:hypothetical protein
MKKILKHHKPKIMKALPALLLVTCLAVISCKDKEKAADNKTVTVTTTSYIQDSTEISQTIKDFYTWYSTHQQNFMKYDLYNGVKKKNEPPYQIDWAVVDKYQGYIHDSVPQLGEAFLSNQKILLQKADSAFKVDKEDDVPAYFDFDWYTNTQEDPAYMLDELNKSKRWNIVVNGDNATAEVKGFDEDGTKPAATVILVEMKKENGKWKIAKTWTD